jgi:hypothetical protein
MQGGNIRSPSSFLFPKALHPRDFISLLVE